MNAQLLALQEEQALAAMYTLINPGAHRPTGLTDEEWASLARSFALSSTSFLLRKYRTALLVKDERGVIKIRLGRKKAHTIYSVPESVAVRIHTRLLNSR